MPSLNPAVPRGRDDGPPERPRLSIDTGGTFTDALLERGSGAISRVKVLSSGIVPARVLARLSPRCWRVSASVDASLLPGWRMRSRSGTLGTVAACSVLGAGELQLQLDMEPPLEADNGAPAHPAGASSIEPGASVDLIAPWPAPILAARILLRIPAGGSLPPLHMRLATTRGTNALLEHRLDPVLVVTNAGLADVFEIGDQRRPVLFDPAPRRPPWFDTRVIETTLRQNAAGDVIEPLDREALAAAAAACGRAQAAVILLHAWRDPGPERQIAGILRSAGVRRVVCSHECSGAEGLLPRGLAAIVDASLSSAVGGFLQEVREHLGPDSTLEVLTSAGSLRVASRFEPRESLLSGPAGGAVALATLRARADRPLLGLDMGGTSTDACRVDASPPLRQQTPIAGFTLAMPSVSIESVAAGGGSICFSDAGSLRVGPRSAGADPGPACYGRGGPLTVTDVDLLLGRAVRELFAVPIDEHASSAALAALVAEQARHGVTRDSLQTLDDLLLIADASMAAAVRAISVREGFDPADHALAAFGGAGGQHACAIAEALGMSQIVHPAGAGVFAAEGVAGAHREWTRTQGVDAPLSLTSLSDAVAGTLAWLRTRAAEDGLTSTRPVRAEACVRMAGRSGDIEVPLALGELELPTAASLAQMRHQAETRYREIFGAAPPALEPELAWVRLTLRADVPEETHRHDRGPVGLDAAAHDRGARPPAAEASPALEEPGRPAAPVLRSQQPMRSRGRWVDARIIDRATLRAGDWIHGPAIVADRHSTLVVETGWSGRVDDGGSIVLSRRESARSRAGPGPGSTVSPPEVMAAAIAAIAVEMGEQLRRTAVSVNVRDRLDFSCGILDRRGRLISSAPHVPVHLGALGACVRAISCTHTWTPGEIVVTNHPAFGGSHLPDVTVVMPLFVDAIAGSSPRLAAFLAARAHHAEIGGIRPGSMSPAARLLHEEGVIIPPTCIARRGMVDLESLRGILASGPHPSRAIEDNLADVSAAVASLRRGAAELAALIDRCGLRSVEGTFMERRARSAACVRRAIALLAQPAEGLPGPPLVARQTLDDGWPIEVRMTPRGDRLRIDFSGSGPVHPGAFNAPLAVTRSAVMYAMRLLVESIQPVDDRSLPLNDGLLEPVDLVVPEGFLHPPPGADLPVAAGNTETSQRVVDALLLALGLTACSQGTMNNLVMGGVRWSFYETIAGGVGATPAQDGASGLHAHMTNTRITDPETLEARFPLRLRRFAFRRGPHAGRPGHMQGAPGPDQRGTVTQRGSGGQGLRRGGDGLIRELEFLEPTTVALISQRRATGPDGLHGGGAGSPGAQWRVHRDGRITALPGVFDLQFEAGERLWIETPGGGGWGGA